MIEKIFIAKYERWQAVRWNLVSMKGTKMILLEKTMCHR